jgi:hypothetical protein
MSRMPAERRVGRPAPLCSDGRGERAPTRGVSSSSLASRTLQAQKRSSAALGRPGQLERDAPSKTLRPSSTPSPRRMRPSVRRMAASMTGVSSSPSLSSVSYSDDSSEESSSEIGREAGACSASSMVVREGRSGGQPDSKASGMRRLEPGGGGRAGRTSDARRVLEHAGRPLAGC